MITLVRRCACILVVAVGVSASPVEAQVVQRRADLPAEPLVGTEPLMLDGDPAELTVAGVDRFLLRELAASVERRATYWQRDFSSPEAYASSVEPNRQRLATMLGLIDARVPVTDIELVSSLRRPARLGRGQQYEVLAVRWPALPGVHGEGLLLQPTSREPVAGVVLIPDCEQLPEQLAGLEPGLAPALQIARRLGESGCRVLVPVLIDRGRDPAVAADGRRGPTHREILYRSAYQMGRHLIGYEVQKVLAAVDALSLDDALPIGVIGYGEGGMLALYSGAVDQRIHVTAVSGYFEPREEMWREPIDRNVFGRLREFGDAEIAALIAPRPLLIEASVAPSLVIEPGSDSAPAELRTPPLDRVREEHRRAAALVSGFAEPPIVELLVSEGGAGPFGSEPWLSRFLQQLARQRLAPVGPAPERLYTELDTAGRRARQRDELARYSQELVDRGPAMREEFLAELKRDRLDDLEATSREYQRYLQEEILGHFDRPKLAARPRTRWAYDEPEFKGYQVVLDVFDDVMLYGILLIPNDLAAGERRPVVVCQHGLEGRAEYAVEGDHTSYRAFGTRLAREGYVVFAPQHLYRGGDAFRTLQRKANPLKQSLFSIMVAQHEQLLAWLGRLEFVDSERIAFYGISYGGKSAMRIPAVLPGYCLSICSSDFSDWIARTVSQRYEHGYLRHSEYEIFEFGLGNHFNYGDLAALICPRPLMVEEFHRAGRVAERNRAEFARVELLYENLGLASRTAIAHWGAYQPNDQYVERETFAFLHRHLRGDD